ncbi:hypothetical protein CAPTEDRAFT_197081 [Capitella teleta]|uniref:Endonuclease/exonuclease/phosphatase domain-containing protein n=1 Tax=Capitella teleta TaxID=283909 RepID=R7VHM2_CAPTE|nr:hypothetical protein CAPTEDRAFT_197081 [Capitella teleta]|eukprot:ELU18077.1 hypothetical protein CAPTEDRAFT_197081 [Capitella teleta]
MGTLQNEHSLKLCSCNVAGYNQCMPDDCVHVGRAFGGCCIVWKAELRCSVLPMVCDNRKIIDHLNVFNEVLNDVSNFAESANVDSIVIGGDLNNDISRQHSWHTAALLGYVLEEDLSLLNGLPMYNVNYTYESAEHGTRSTLDHFLVSDRLLQHVESVHVEHSALNPSDHSVLLLSLNVQVSSVPRNPAGSRWSGHQCTEHAHELRVYYKALVDACLRAGLEFIPHSTQRGGNSRSPVPMWSALVQPLRDQAMFWQALWKECGSPATGEVALVRRITRARYHRAIRHLKRNNELARFCAMGGDFIQGGHGDFWSEVRRMRGRGEAAPSCVDGEFTDFGIAALFETKYRTLYNSVGFDPRKMQELVEETNQNVLLHQDCPSHLFTHEELIACMKDLKPKKHDGDLGYYADHLRHAPHRCFCCLLIVLNALLSHGVVPEEMCVSTVTPIPKKYAEEFNLSFNAGKSKLICVPHNNATPAPPISPVVFMGGTTELVPHDRHLGCLVGNATSHLTLDLAISDFNKRVGMVRSHFRWLPEAKYFLFKSYCMPLYGSVLWDFTQPCIERFYTAWRKAVRSLLGLHPRTHCTLLPQICDDRDPEKQLLARFVGFVKSLSSSANEIVQTCFSVALDGSRSSIGKTLSLVCEKARCARDAVLCGDPAGLFPRDPAMAAEGSLVRDLLVLRHEALVFKADIFPFVIEEITHMIEFVCLN